MNFIVVSGLSGSGKTIALQALEDLGYYCADNLPASLLADFASRLMGEGDVSAAVSIDSRNRRFLEDLPASLDQLRTLGVDYKIIFLEANETVLLKRYSTTRRRHPMTDASTPLLEGIRREKELLAPLAADADKHIDTTARTPHELHGLVRDFAGEVHLGGINLLFQSFGFKHGAPVDADFVFDVRCLPNPYWDTSLRELDGRHAPVIRFLESQDSVAQMIEHIATFLEYWLPSFEKEHRSYITIAIGCTGGQHRSVYITDRLTERFAGSDHLNVHTRHRELL
ncbi:MAG: RNase adapter RapZ [Gammaproteobacteria bacterium]|nr:RNase adapter RapZ [Gammaproteobacteria bacterium]